MGQDHGVEFSRRRVAHKAQCSPANIVKGDLPTNPAEELAVRVEELHEGPRCWRAIHRMSQDDRSMVRIGIHSVHVQPYGVSTIDLANSFLGRHRGEGASVRIEDANGHRCPSRWLTPALRLGVALGLTGC